MKTPADIKIVKNTNEKILLEFFILSILHKIITALSKVPSKNDIGQRKTREITNGFGKKGIFLLATVLFSHRNGFT